MKHNLYMEKVGKDAKIASEQLTNLSLKKRNAVLRQFSKYLETNLKLILKANKKDIIFAKSKKIKSHMINRLLLNEKKIMQIKNSINAIIKFKDPLGKIIQKWKRPNNLIIKKVTVVAKAKRTIIEVRILRTYNFPQLERELVDEHVFYNLLLNNYHLL